jgi:tryptophan-rich sensory protein
MKLSLDRGSILKLAACILICEFAGIIGSVFTYPNITTWYAGIQKPWFNPPNWIFGPAWTILYALMGIALYLVWKKGFEKKESRIALSVFVAQLALNTLWSLLFFGAKNLGLAFAEIIIMWFAILANIILFYRIDRRAGLILVPYILWVSFASLLTYSVWVLNP